MKRKVKKTILALFIALAVVSFWRGVWGLMDFYLFPNNSLLSFASSILIGVVILYFTESLTERLI